MVSLFKSLAGNNLGGNHCCGDLLSYLDLPLDGEQVDGFEMWLLSDFSAAFRPTSLRWLAEQPSGCINRARSMRFRSMQVTDTASLDARTA